MRGQPEPEQLQRPRGGAPAPGDQRGHGDRRYTIAYGVGANQDVAEPDRQRLGWGGGGGKKKKGEYAATRARSKSVYRVDLQLLLMGMKRHIEEGDGPAVGPPIRVEANEKSVYTKGFVPDSALATALRNP